MDSICLELSIAVAKGWKFHQMGMKNAFLHDDLYEEIYMDHPHGFVQDSYLVCRLKKSLYGLKQASRAWYAKKYSYLLPQKFVHFNSDTNVYMLKTVDSLLLLVLYVDDLLIIGCSTSVISAVKRILHDMFFMTYMGLLHFFLGIDINQDVLSIKLSQAKYAQNLLERFYMTKYKSSPTPFL
jgi:hypothetical protein